MDYLSPFLEQMSQGVQVAQRLRQTAQDQQELAEKKRQFDIDNELRQRQQAQQQQQQGLASRLNLARSGATPVNNGTFGGEMETPTAPLPSLGPDNTLTQTALPNATAPTQVPVGPQDNTVAYGGQQYRIPSQQEQDDRSLRKQELAEETKRRVANEDNVPLGDDLAEAAGLPPGTKVPRQQYGSLTRLYGQLHKPTTEKPPKTTVTLTDQDSKLLGMPAGTEVPIDEYRARTTMFSDNARATKADREAQPKPPTRQQYQSIEQRKQDALAKSADEFRKDVDKARLAPGQYDQDALESAKQAHLDRQRAAQSSYEQEVGALTGNDVAHNDWADSQTSGKPSNAPNATVKQGQTQQAAPAAAAKPQASGKPKAASYNDVVDYATKKIIKVVDAVKEFQKFGYTINP